jgi:ribosomal protein S18 acetylase RimI-like enzyme
MIDKEPGHCRYTLRDATEADRAFVLALWRESLGELVKELFGKWDDVAADRNCAKKLNTGLQIIEVGDQAVGILHLSLENDWLSLNEIELVSENRNLGLGTQVLRDIQAYADANKLNLELQVLVTNRAVRLYERLGFKPTHTKMARLFIASEE